MKNKITVRFTEEKDKTLLESCFREENVLHWYPMDPGPEVEDCVRIWMELALKKEGITAEYEGVSCGMAVLYVSPFKKYAHQCLFAIIVAEKYRQKGVGARLIEEIKKIAKQNYHIEILHLEVYEENPAISLYKKMGFEEYGVEKRFIKEKEGYFNKVLMRQDL